jgi:hypothetical protein
VPGGVRRCKKFSFGITLNWYKPKNTDGWDTDPHRMTIYFTAADICSDTKILQTSEDSATPEPKKMHHEGIHHSGTRAQSIDDHTSVCSDQNRITTVLTLSLARLMTQQVTTKGATTFNLAAGGHGESFLHPFMGFLFRHRLFSESNTNHTFQKQIDRRRKLV